MKAARSEDGIGEFPSCDSDKYIGNFVADIYSNESFVIVMDMVALLHSLNMFCKCGQGHMPKSSKKELSIYPLAILWSLSSL